MANLVEIFNQCILAEGPEGNVEVDRGAVRRTTQIVLFVEGRSPKVFDTHVTSR